MPLKDNDAKEIIYFSLALDNSIGIDGIKITSPANTKSILSRIRQHIKSIGYITVPVWQPLFDEKMQANISRECYADPQQVDLNKMAVRGYLRKNNYNEKYLICIDYSKNDINEDEIEVFLNYYF